MTGYLVKRLMFAAGAVWLTTTLVFLLLRVTPGDPSLAQQGIVLTPERIALVRAEQGLDDPLPEQYIHWIGRLIHGDLGRSSLTRVAVVLEIKDRFPVSLELMLLTVTWVALAG